MSGRRGNRELCVHKVLEMNKGEDKVNSGVITQNKREYDYVAHWDPKGKHTCEKPQDGK